MMKLVLVLALLVGAAAHAADLGKPDQHATTEAIEKDWKDFAEVYKDQLQFIDSDVVRTPNYIKTLNSFGIENSPEKQKKLREISKKLVEAQKGMRSSMLLSTARASEKQFSKFYKIAKEVAAKLEMSQNFNLFIVNVPVVNAFTYSHDINNFDIVLFNGLIENCSDEAITSVIAHEMGHVKDQAILWGQYYVSEILMPILNGGFLQTGVKTILPKGTLQKISDTLYAEIPEPYRSEMASMTLGTLGEMVEESSSAVSPMNMGGGEFIMDAIMKFFEFRRQGELTADRYAILYNLEKQDAALAAMMALAYSGKTYAADLNAEELVKQMEEAINAQVLEEDDDKVKDLLDSQQSHPYVLSRLMQMREYGESKEFKSMRTGITASAFGKELYFLNIYTVDLKKVKTKFDEYMKNTAANEDAIWRSRTEKKFKAEMAKYEPVVKMLTDLILLQVEGFGFDKENVLFTEVATKLKEEQYAPLKETLAVEMQKLLAERITKLTEADAKEHVTKLKKLDELTGKTTNVVYLAATPAQVAEATDAVVKAIIDAKEKAVEYVKKNF